MMQPEQDNSESVEFEFVDHVLRKTGAMSSVEGSLVITDGSITFIGPALGDDMRQGSAARTGASLLGTLLTLIPPFSIAGALLKPQSRADRQISLLEGRKAAGCALVVFGALFIAAVVWLIVRGDTEALPFVIVLSALVLIYLVYRVWPRKPKWKKHMESTGQVSKDPGGEKDSVPELDFHSAVIVRELMESDNIEKRLKALVKYRRGSINLQRGNIQLIDYAGGGRLAVTTGKRKYSFKILEKKSRAPLEQSLRDFRYL